MIMNSIQPLISIIVPVYNSEKFLKECVSSIENQIYKNIEVILVNDGSKDNSGAICDELMEAYPNITVIHKANGGASSARNRGLEIASGEYVSFIDSDDYIHPKMYLTLFTLMKHNDVDIVGCNFCRVSSDGSKRLKVMRIQKKPILQYEDENILKDFLISKLDCSPCNKLYKRATIGDLRFPEGVINEDKVFLFLLYSKIPRLLYTNEILYYYRNNPESVTHSTSVKKFSTAFFDTYKNALCIENLSKSLLYNIQDEISIYKLKTAFSSCFALLLIGKKKLYYKEYSEMRKNILNLSNFFWDKRLSYKDRIKFIVVRLIK